MAGFTMVDPLVVVYPWPWSSLYDLSEESVHFEQVVSYVLRRWRLRVLSPSGPARAWSPWTKGLKRCEKGSDYLLLGLQARKKVSE